MGVISPTAASYGSATKALLPTRAALAFLPLHLATTGLIVLVCLTVLELRAFEPPTSHDLFALTTGLTTIGLIAYVRWVLRLPWMSASVVYLVLFWLFHFGMTFTAVVVPSVLSSYTVDDLEWLYWPNVRAAMILGVIGAAGFVFGVGLFAPRAATTEVAAADDVGDRGLFVIGWVVMPAGILASWVITIQNAGAEVLSMGYLRFLAIYGATDLSTTLGLAHLGCLLASCGAARRRWVAPLAVWFLGAALPLLLLGARSGALVPLAGFVLVLTYRGVRWNRGFLIASAMIALFAIPAIQAFRLVGFANRASVNWTDVTPLDTFTELGGSLRATKAYVDWIEEGDDYLFGATYWAPFDRQLLTRVIPDREPIPFAQEVRVPQRLMDEREAAVGGSATGEAYYNFGPYGPFIYFGLIGMMFGALEGRVRGNPYGCAFLGVIMFLFYFNIRGDWLAIPVQVAEGVALLACCYVVGRFIPTSVPWRRADRSAA